MTGFLDILDLVLFLLLAWQVLYLFVFAIANLFSGKSYFPTAHRKRRFLIVFPAYKEDSVIINSVKTFFKQDYSSDFFHLVVAADQMTEEVCLELESLGAHVLRVAFDNSSKAKAMQYAFSKFSETDYDKALILDADNVVDSDFLDRLNNCFDAGADAIQAHRKAKNLNTNVAVLDALSEEINNSIFRRGHVVLGFSSSLIGSGMAFDFNWIKNHVDLLKTSGEDKELEAMLFKEHIYLTFLDEAVVYDEKTAKVETFSNQRRRWLSAQFYSFISSIKDLPKALISRNYDYADKIIQWAMLPRVILIGLVFLCSILTTLYLWSWSVKWWILIFVLALSLSFSIPDELVDKKLRKAFRYIPILGLKMFFNLFRLKGENKKFIHTKHEA